MPKLKEHILPRIKNILASDPHRDAETQQSGLSSAGDHNNDMQEHNFVLFKNDCMYQHHLARFNYTTYDVRRAQDIINPGTSHCDVMLLKNSDNTETHLHHLFLYARVLGIYHVNVVYTGMDMLDYKPRRVDFLWVRWFEYDGVRSFG